MNKRTTDETATLITLLLFIALFVVGLIGWVLNIVALCDMGSFSGLMALRIIGIFLAPLGAVLGFV